MALENVGSIAYDARIDTNQFSRDADKVEKRASETASTIEKSGNRAFRNFASDASESFGSIADGLGRIIKSALIIGATGSVGIGAMTKASWDQVSAVQQATLALNAYEKDTSKVNKTLSELVAYARSDLGVLFNRKDLFAAAQQLKIMGDNTDELTNHVKIMSRSVGLGLSTWEGLGNVINRVGSTGMLYADDLKYLQNAGFKLDSSLSGTTQTFESLFKVLDKGIPADAMAGQASTIVGLNVRMQTAFRNLGDAILGVDADSGKFVSGGLGDKLVGMLSRVTVLLKSPELKLGFKRMGESIGRLAEGALTLLISAFTWIVNNINTVVAGIASLATAFVVAKVAAIGFAIAAAANPVILIASAITILVGALTYLQLKFGYVTKGLDILRPSFQLIGDTISDIGSRFSGLGDKLGGIDWKTEAVNAIKRALELLNSTIIYTGVVVKQTVRNIIDFIDTVKKLYNQFANWTPVQIVVQYLQQVLWPALKAIGAAIVQNLLPALAQLWGSFTRIWNALNPGLTTALKLVGGILIGYLMVNIWAVTTAINLLVQAISFVISIISNLINWVSNLIGWFGNLVGVVINLGVSIVGVFMSTLDFIRSNWQSIIAILTGPIGIAVALIVRNFDTLRQAFLNVKNWVSGVFASVGEMAAGAFKGVVNAVIGTAERTINKFIGAINGALGAINKIPGVNISKLGELSIPKLAEGGIVQPRRGGVLANIAEGGQAEAVIPLDKLDNILQGGDGGRAVTINLNMSGIMARSTSDLRDVGKDILRAINQELTAKGQPAIGGIT